jgi:riboflavin kinase/FMN adenylyltransferase
VLADWERRLGRALDGVTVPFASVQRMEPQEFVAFIHREFGAVALVVGEDFRFGRGRSGGIAELRQAADELGCPVAVVPPVGHGGRPISSSRVREALAAGDVAQAALCLGRPHRVIGTVVRGDGRGRTLGVPTANCGLRENQEPGPGVYAAFAELGAGERRPRLPAAVNVGHVPTAGSGRALTVEAHLIGFSGDCYGQRLALDLVARLREERRFPSLEALTAQIRKDIAAARGITGLAQ